jgi:hypothetical protein
MVLFAGLGIGFEPHPPGQPRPQVQQGGDPPCQRGLGKPLPSADFPHQDIQGRGIADQQATESGPCPGDGGGTGRCRAGQVSCKELST